MTELWISYSDTDGAERRVSVDKDEFIIGRHSGADLCIPSGRLSREHVKIERFGDVFVATDLGSTNGTKINGTDLREATSLKNGDTIDLGGITVSLTLESSASVSPAFEDLELPDIGQNAGSIEPDSDHAPTAAAALPVQPKANSSIPTGLLLIAPVFGLALVIFAVGLIYVFSTGGEAREPDVDEFVYTKNDDGPKNSRKKAEGVPLANENSQAQTSPSSSTSISDTNSPGPATPELSETQKTEQHAAAFLRRIAQNDPKAFLTSDQAAIVNNKIKQLSGSSALADNINSARKAAPQIRSIAAAKNLKPQFLAVAGITKLGNSRGDVLQAAQSMADVFDRLATQIGNELADDSLLMIAAYDQGVAGDFMKMRNMLQDLSTKFPESSRSIRTVWFLHKNGKITNTEFDLAVRFLAIGAIMQNPRDFNVNCEALAL